MKVLYLTNLPSSYKVDFFNELGKKCELTVLFERDSATNRDNKWQNFKFDNFEGIFLNGIKIGEENSLSFKVKKYILKGKFDKIVIGGYGTLTSMYALNLLKRKNIPYILSVDGGIVKGEKGFKYKIKKYFIGGASKYLCPSQKTKEYLLYYGATEENILFYPFTSLKEKEIVLVNENEKINLKQEVLSTNNKVLLTVGQFIKRKGFDLLIKSANSLTDYLILIVGGTPTEEYLALIEENSIKNVQFMPFLDKETMNKIYSLADLFVLPTREDIWGLVINEAMAKGLGVITTNNCIAGLELVKEGENGFIIDTESVEKIVKSVRLAEEKGLKNLGKKSIELIKNYTIESMTKIIYEAFED